MNKGQRKKQGEEAPTDPRTNVVKSAIGFLRKYPFSFPRCINGCNPVAKRFFRRCFINWYVIRGWQSMNIMMIILWPMFPGKIHPVFLLHWPGWCHAAI
jgi:hypothetical protein